MKQEQPNIEISKTEILQVVHSYLESMSSEEGKPADNKARSAPSMIAAAELKASKERARRKSGASLAFYGTMWCVWGVTLTLFIYVNAMPAAAYAIAWAILSYGVYQLLRGIPLRFGM